VTETVTMVRGWPRRRDTLRWSDAERAINEAVQAVERMGANMALTDAVVLLAQAQERVAAYVDAHPGPAAATREPAAREAYFAGFTQVPGTVHAAFVSEGEVIVLGSPPESDDEETGHNCDAMGCGYDHVLWRGAAAPTPPAPEDTREGVCYCGHHHRDHDRMIGSCRACECAVFDMPDPQAPPAAVDAPILGPVRCLCDEPGPVVLVDAGMWGSRACGTCRRLLVQSGPPVRPDSHGAPPAAVAPAEPMFGARPAMQCATHGAQRFEWHEGDWRCQVCGEPAVGAVDVYALLDERDALASEVERLDAEVQARQSERDDAWVEVRELRAGRKALADMVEILSAALADDPARYAVFMARNVRATDRLLLLNAATAVERSSWPLAAQNAADLRDLADRLTAPPAVVCDA
jgi:hypothetical protein